MIRACAEAAEHYATAIIPLGGFALVGFFMWLVLR